jgi:hypothetical protein
VEKFITEFNEVMKENGLDKKLIELINNNLLSFGPKKAGPNLLINR